MYKVCFWVLVIAVSVISLLPIENLSLPILNWWDKAQHTLCFIVLGCFGLKAYSELPPAKIILGLCFFGACIEFAQAATGWRFGEYADFMADVLGLLVALIFMWVIGVVRFTKVGS